MDMNRRNVNLLINWLILAAAFVAFSTGIVLLVRFHMGHGAFAKSALGMDKLVWLNVHRFSALIVGGGVVAHAVLHWKTLQKNISNFISHRAKRRVNIEVVMYSVFLVSALSSLIAWWVLDGSSPIFGPAVIERMSGARHHWIDTHNFASLFSLALITHHIGHRLRFMFPH